MLRSNSGGKSGLRARFEPIASSSDTLNSSKLLAGAAEPNMNVLILHTELRRELFHSDTFVTGSTQGREDAGFQRAAPAASGLRSGKLARSSCQPGARDVDRGLFFAGRWRAPTFCQNRHP